MVSFSCLFLQAIVYPKGKIPYNKDLYLKHKYRQLAYSCIACRNDYRMTGWHMSRSESTFYSKCLLNRNTFPLKNVSFGCKVKGRTSRNLKCFHP